MNGMYGLSLCLFHRHHPDAEFNMEAVLSLGKLNKRGKLVSVVKNDCAGAAVIDSKYKWRLLH
jgi:hypothetical protein